MLRPALLRRALREKQLKCLRPAKPREAQLHGLTGAPTSFARFVPDRHRLLLQKYSTQLSAPVALNEDHRIPLSKSSLGGKRFFNSTASKVPLGADALEEARISKSPGKYTNFVEVDNLSVKNDNMKLLRMTQRKQINFEKMEAMLVSIEKDPNITLNEMTFFNMVKNCVAAGNIQAAEAAEALVLEWMLKFHKQSQLNKPPDGNIFGMLLQTWVTTGHRQSGQRAEELLDKLETLEEEGSLPAFMDTAKYSTVMKAYAIHGDFKNAQRILDRCTAAFERGNQSARPNLRAWNTVLDGCAKSGLRNAWKIAEKIVNKMRESHEEGLLHESPDAIFYNTLIHVCAKSNEPERAEFWLEEMFRDYTSGNSSAQPDLYSFSSVLDGWARTCTEEGTERSGKILNRMIKLANEGTLPVRPNKFSYCTVINACDKSMQPEKAEFWLQQMYKDYQRGNKTAQPDVKAFSAVMSALAGTGTVESAKKCEDLLALMIKEANNGLPVRPDTVSYSIVINACAKSNQPQRAEFWLEQMYKDFKNGNWSAKPETNSLNSVMDAWARLGTLEGAEKCDSLLAHMKKHTNQESFSVRPDTVSCNIVIHAWALLGRADKAGHIFSSMLGDYTDGKQRTKPDMASCRSLLKAIQNSGRENAGETADAFLENMAKLNLKPDITIYVLVLKCWECASEHGHFLAMDRISELTEMISKSRKP